MVVIVERHRPQFIPGQLPYPHVPRTSHDTAWWNVIRLDNSLLHIYINKLGHHIKQNNYTTNFFVGYRPKKWPMHDEFSNNLKHNYLGESLFDISIFPTLTHKILCIVFRDTGFYERIIIRYRNPTPIVTN